ncbi:MAG: tetratricopeptide repeat protein [Candidatus Tumulicola sp.]
MPSPRKRALALLRRRDFEGAERELTALLLDHPDDRAFLLNKRGVARVGMKRLELAREDFTAALACAANYPPALTNLGNLLLEAGQNEAAIARYEAAIRANPDYAAAHLNLGVAYKRAGRIDEAVRSLRRAQRLDRTSALGFLRRRPPW